MENEPINSVVIWAWRVSKLELSCALVFLVENPWKEFPNALWQIQSWYQILYFAFLLGIFVILPVSIIVNFTAAKNKSIIGVTATDLVMVVLILMALPLLLFWPRINDIYFPGQITTIACSIH